jgi:hypothetical protein
MNDLPYGKIDYGALVSAAIAAPGVTEAFAADLAAQGVHVDTAWRSLWWLAPVYLWSLPPESGSHHSHCGFSGWSGRLPRRRCG